MPSASRRGSSRSATCTAPIGSTSTASSPQARAVNAAVLEDRVVQLDPDFVARVVAALTDPRATDAGLALMRQARVPPEEIWFRRVQLGVLAVQGQLRARGNWHRTMR